MVTGGASGMGRALTDRFAQAGMRVVVADIAQQPLDAADTEITATGARAIGGHGLTSLPGAAPYFRQAKPPHEVADLVHDAVLARQFWIFTDDVYTPSIHERLDSIRDATDPPARGSLVEVNPR